MGIERNGVVLRELRTLFGVGAIGDLTDGQLLERFATDRGDAAEHAFAALIERHGPMVLRVCRGVLADPHDAQDAFQATFLVLVKKARALWVRDSLGPWLHQVAFRTASCARKSAARRRRHERLASKLAKDTGCQMGDESGRLLHEEIDRLPDRYRAPLILCDLEGRTHEQAARHLGWPIGTVKSRQSRGRERLRQRLLRRGLGSDAGLIGPASLVPPALVDSTTSVIVQFALARTFLGGSAASLAQEVIRSMSMTRWLKVGSLLLVLGATAPGVGMLFQDAASSTQPPRGERLKGAPVDKLPVIPVKPGKFSVTLVERGSLESSDNNDVHCLVEGNTTIIKILPEGTWVKKGQIVCELDSAALRDRLMNQRIATKKAEGACQEAKLDRELAELAVREYTEGLYKQEQAIVAGEIAVASSSIQWAEARLARTRAAQQRLKNGLLAKGAVTEVMAELDIEDRLAAAEQTLEREKVALELANTKRKLLEEYTRVKTTKALEIAVSRSRSHEPATTSARDLELSKEENLERQIAACEIKAPSDGYVVYANDPGPGGNLGNRRPQIEEGATVRERQIIFSVPNLGRMQVNARVGEPRVDQLLPGMKARVRVDFLPDQVLTGTVRDIAPRPAPGRSSSDIKIYPTHVTIDEPLPALRPGMTAEVEILIYEADNVLSVPVKSILIFDGTDHVAVKKPDGGFEWREVVLGRSDEKMVEVKQGLNGGDVVIFEPLALMSEDEKRQKFGSPPRPTRPAARKAGP